MKKAIFSVIFAYFIVCITLVAQWYFGSLDEKTMIRYTTPLIVTVATAVIVCVCIIILMCLVLLFDMAKAKVRGKPIHPVPTDELPGVEVPNEVPVSMSEVQRKENVK